MKNELLLNLYRVHTTELGIKRIKRNIGLDNEDVVNWCKEIIKNSDSSIIRKGKNWYVKIHNCEITINAHSYTIITAHKTKGEK